MQEYTNEESKQEKVEQLKKWLQDNLRIIVSIVIVAVIAGGIYSYSKRVESPIVSDESATTEQSEDGNDSAEAGNKDDKAATDESKADSKKEQVAPGASSKETESAFIETAGRGDSATRLARRALADYLEKNPDSALTKEHKIYIEDFLRKNVPTKQVNVGTSMEFSKDLIQKAVEKSKTLNDKQLKNLEKFSARVSSI